MNRTTLVKKKYDWDAYIMLGPILLIFAIGVLYPIIGAIRFSFLEWKGLGLPKFVGINNYVKLFKDPNFHNALKITVVWTISSTVLSVGLGWFFALLSGLSPKSSTPFRLFIFAAYGISAVVSGIIWKGIYQPDFGLLNGVLDALGSGNLTRAWLGDSNTALWAVIIAFVWTQVGLPLLLIYASIRAIPVSLFESALIDGATQRNLIRYLMIPLSLPGVRVSIFINLLNSLKSFDIIFILTAGGPSRGTETLGYFMYQEAIGFFKLGYGATVVIVLSIVVFLIAIPLLKERTQESL